MNVLLIGSGGRESALAWKMSKSPILDKLYILPGNGGTMQYGENVEGNPLDFDFVKTLVAEKNINMVVVGPEDPLVAGISDSFSSDLEFSSVAVIGPSAMGAQLEGSKDFAKEFMARHGIPTARYFTCTLSKISEGFAFLESLKPPYVLKADGLAAGKGVIICPDLSEAKANLKEMLEGKFGKSSAKVLIEEFLKGIEVSYFVATDGESYVLLPEAKDYKRIGEGDTGPNTGGMGAISPVPFATRSFTEKVEKQIVIPTIEGLKKENINYKGFVFFGLIQCDGEPFVIEYNARLGDPETEAIVPRIESDLLEMFLAIAKKSLANFQLSVSPDTAATVMLVSDGYPGEYKKNMPVSGLEKVSNSVVFHAGTRVVNGELLTNGGRVMAVSSVSSSINRALKLAYRNADVIDFEGKKFRRDLGFDLA